jgi:type I restriction enzyme S subunit
MTVPRPSNDEQIQIIRYIENETKSSETAIERTQREIQLLREYRTRLVADVVTGKLDVRPAAAKLPAVAEPESLAPETIAEEVDEIENEIETEGAEA